MSESLPAITGRQLARLLDLGGWSRGRRVTHGVAFRKVDAAGQPRLTIVPDKSRPLASGTLAAILGPKQSGLGRDGLIRLIEEHGIR